VIDPPVLPVIIGVTGHRDIAPKVAARVRLAVRLLLMDWHKRYGRALHVMTALADGADQLVAAEALKQHIPIIVTLPMRLDVYRSTLRCPDALSRYLDRAELTIVLPDVQAASALTWHERQYEQLGVFLARRSHLLLALWDGEPTPNGRAGTAAVARMRLEGDQVGLSFLGTPTVLDDEPLLTMTNRGPLLHIRTPRRSDPDLSSAGSWSLLGLVDQGKPDPPRPAEAACQVHEHLGPRMLRDFSAIRRLNEQIGDIHGASRSRFERQIRDLNADGIPARARGLAHILRRTQAGADAIAQSYQIRLMGRLAPIQGPRDAFRKIRALWRDERVLPMPGAVFCFAASLPAAAVCFEAADDLALGHIFVIPYLAILAGAWMYYQFRIIPGDWQNRFQDCRAIAEALRVQLYWALAAIPDTVSDHYLWKQSDEVGWIQFALRGPSPWATALALTLDEPQRQAVMTGWVAHQHDYFASKALSHEAAARRGQAWSKRFFMFGILAAAVLAGSWYLHDTSYPYGSLLKPELTWATRHEGVLPAITVILPALAGFFKLSIELRAYEPQSKAYDLMRGIFERARRQADAIEAIPDPARRHRWFRTLVLELGRAALAENAEWLVDHRHRKIEN
jgi:hypothetical protein